MGAKTEISWTDATWNPIRGCSMAKGSETGGCLNCYAARMAARNLPELKSPTTGESFARILQSGPRWTGKVELIESQLALPLKWRKGKRIFVNSMSDLFHESLPDEQIDRVFAEMALCPQHTFQVLTKRPERMLSYFLKEIPLSRRDEYVASLAEHTGNIVWDARGSERHLYSSCGQIGDISNRKPWPGWPLPNVWLGVSVENQATADARIPLLLQTPAAIRFVSYEPALDQIDIDGYLRPCDDDLALEVDLDKGWERGLDWIIIGGESGPGARPFDVAWARNAIAQCREAGVACFVKQFGANPVTCVDGCSPVTGSPWRLNDRKGGDMSEWPEDLRVRQFPCAPELIGGAQ